MRTRISMALLAAILVTLSEPMVWGQGNGLRGGLVFSACQEAGTMTVHAFSDPPDANLHVDGTFIGQTPAKLCLRAGRHKIRVSQPGYVDGAWDFETLPGSEVLLQAELKQGPTEAEMERLYVKSSAAVWALRSIEDDKSCRQALENYQGGNGDWTPMIRTVIETTYRDVMGACDANDPTRATRDKARRYLIGLRVRR